MRLTGSIAIALGILALLSTEAYMRSTGALWAAVEAAPEDDSGRRPVALPPFSFRGVSTAGGRQWAWVRLFRTGGSLPLPICVGVMRLDDGTWVARDDPRYERLPLGSAKSKFTLGGRCDFRRDTERQLRRGLRRAFH